MLAATTHSVTHQTGAISWTERYARIKSAFVDSAIASTSALNAVLVSVYRHAPESLAHAHRVAWLGGAIARELRLEGRDLDDLERAAWTHDLGKFVVPYEPGAAEDDLEHWVEQLLVAGEILGAVPFLAPAARLVLASRECFDGSGYPFGLARKAIPLAARVLHVADTFDALAAVCSSLNVAREAADDEIVRHAGSRFDPDVVAACLRCVDSLPIGVSASGARC